MSNNDIHWWTAMTNDPVEDDEEISTIQVKTIPVDNILPDDNSGISFQSCNMEDITSPISVTNLEELNINTLMNLTNPDCSYIPQYETPNSPQIHLIDVQTLNAASPLCIGNLSSAFLQSRNDSKEDYCKNDWSNYCPDGDWTSFYNAEEYVPPSPSFSEVSTNSCRWTPISDDHPILVKPKIQIQPVVENTETSTNQWMTQLSRKVKRILIPRLRCRGDADRLTGAFVDSRLHTLIAEKINDIIQSADDVETLGAEYIARKIVNDSEVKHELDSLCPLIAKMIFTSRQFRQLQVRIQHPTVRDHLERPESAKLQKLLMASKRYKEKELNALFRSPREHKALKTRIPIRINDSVCASDSELSYRPHDVPYDVSIFSDDQTSSTIATRIPPEKIIFKALPLQPKNHRGIRELDSKRKATLIDPSNISKHNTPESLIDREPPEIPMKKILREFDRNPRS